MATNPEPVGQSARRSVQSRTVLPLRRTGGAGVTPATSVAIPLSPSRVALVLGAVAGALVLAGGLGDAARYLADQDRPVARAGQFLRAAFGPSREQTVGTWYASSLLLVAAGLLAVVAATERAGGGSGGRHWWGLAGVFVFLSGDEAIGIHERLGDWVGRRIAGDGVLRWEWVIPYAIFALGVAAIYLPFLLRLPARTRHLFLLAGALYVGGALVLEGVQAQVVETYGTGTVANTVLASVEEAAELAGVIVLIYALLSRLAGHARLRLTIDD